MSFTYWNYYDDEFDWDDSQSLLLPNLDHSRSVFVANGMTESEASRYVASGYVCFEGFDVVVDRYYGGALSSFDFRCRFPVRGFSRLTPEPRSNVWVYPAKSREDVRQKVEEHAAASSRRLLFRGQTQNYALEREINNPFFTVPELGEISLLPSFWRRLLSKNRNSFLEFANLTLFEWSHVFYSRFDLNDIERRHKKLIDEGEFVFTMSDMEDCSDAVLREFGKYRLDLACHFDNNLAPVLATLLQHYGLYSPVLDLTESLDVAIFFATHKFKRLNGQCRYEFVGTNRRQSVLYVFREDKTEMECHNGEEEIIRHLDPLRPKRQDCIIAQSSPYAVNLPADFLDGVILLDYDLGDSSNCLSTQHLFPRDHEDAFLRACKTSPYASRYLTDF